MKTNTAARQLPGLSNGLDWTKDCFGNLNAPAPRFNGLWSIITSFKHGLCLQLIQDGRVALIVPAGKFGVEGLFEAAAAHEGL